MPERPLDPDDHDPPRPPLAAVGVDRRPAAAPGGAPPRGADLTGRTLLALCALSTAVAFADGLTRVAAAPAEWALTEFWRTAAYLVFAGMWALLAVRPRSQRGMWELIVLHKALVTVHALLMLDLPGAAQTAWVDGVLVAATVTAWVLCRGWLTWRRPSPLDGPTPGSTG